VTLIVIETQMRFLAVERTCHAKEALRSKETTQDGLRRLSAVHSGPDSRLQELRTRGERKAAAMQAAKAKATVTRLIAIE
jgi:hypothetical protein